MVLKIFNTLKKEKEDFEPFKDKIVKMFVCGPTVYDHSHLGHVRTYIAYDIITRYLRFRKYKVFFLMNITDVDDKIINRAKERKIDPIKLAREFEDSFYVDMIKLKLLKNIDKFARASEHIKEIISQIQRLLDKDFAYVTENGIYFDITKFTDYGKLSHQDTEQLNKHRIEPDPTKKNQQDFALWKFQKKTEFGWDSPWGFGRPGWHIEDTAIAEKYLGQQYDIHGGGLDLIFPHHESEIAQMESISGKKPMVKYWTHTGFLNVNGQKMAKSLGNFITVKDALNKYDVETLRLFFAFTHYRSPIDFSEKNIQQSKKSLETLYNALENIQSLKVKTGKLTEDEKELKKDLKEYKQVFIECMNDDFNTPNALSVIFDLAKTFNKFADKNKQINKILQNKAIRTLRQLGGIFGILQKKIEENELTIEIAQLIKQREEARKNKNWITADNIREKLKNMGIIIEDTAKGVKLKKKKN